jgi:hypothetical protein
MFLNSGYLPNIEKTGANRQSSPFTSPRKVNEQYKSEDFLANAVSKIFTFRGDALSPNSIYCFTFESKYHKAFNRNNSLLPGKFFATFFVKILKNVENSTTNTPFESYLTSIIFPENETNESIDINRIFKLLLIHVIVLTKLDEEQYKIYLQNIVSKVTNMRINVLSLSHKQKLAFERLYDCHLNFPGFFEKLDDLCYTLPVYDGENVRFDNKLRYSPTMETILIILCNHLFYDPGKGKQSLEHLNLNVTSLLLKFYRRHGFRPNDISKDVLVDFAKVVQGLDDPKIDDKGVEVIYDKIYYKSPYRNEIRGDFINLMTVLATITNSLRNKMIEKYKTIMESDDLLEIKIEKFLNLLVIPGIYIRITTSNFVIQDGSGIYFGSLEFEFVDQKNKAGISKSLKITLKNENSIIEMSPNNQDILNTSLSYVETEMKSLDQKDTLTILTKNYISYLKEAYLGCFDFVIDENPSSYFELLCGCTLLDSENKKMKYLEALLVFIIKNDGIENEFTKRAKKIGIGILKSVEVPNPAYYGLYILNSELLPIGYRIYDIWRSLYKIDSKISSEVIRSAWNKELSDLKIIFDLNICGMIYSADSVCKMIKVLSPTLKNLTITRLVHISNLNIEEIGKTLKNSNVARLNIISCLLTDENMQEYGAII